MAELQCHVITVQQEKESVGEWGNFADKLGLSLELVLRGCVRSAVSSSTCSGAMVNHGSAAAAAAAIPGYAANQQIAPPCHRDTPKAKSCIKKINRAAAEIPRGLLLCATAMTSVLFAAITAVLSQ